MKTQFSSETEKKIRKTIQICWTYAKPYQWSGAIQSKKTENVS